MSDDTTKPADAADRVRRYCESSARAVEELGRTAGADMVRAAELIADALGAGGKVLLCGNGGSAADVQHVASELLGVLDHTVLVRPGLAAVALTADPLYLTASANDFGFDQIFERQVAALGRAGDVLIGISTSGNSANVVRAIERAAEVGLGTVVLTGRDGGRAAAIANVAVRVPVDRAQQVQEAHTVVGHVLCGLVEERLFNGTHL